MTSEQRLGQFLRALAENDMSTTTPNQAFNAVIFPWKKIVGAEVQVIRALRARCQRLSISLRSESFKVIPPLKRSA
jgi:hypothetical protein